MKKEDIIIAQQLLEKRQDLINNIAKIETHTTACVVNHLLNAKLVFSIEKEQKESTHYPEMMGVHEFVMRFRGVHHEKEPKEDVGLSLSLEIPEVIKITDMLKADWEYKIQVIDKRLEKMGITL